MAMQTTDSIIHWIILHFIYLII